MSYSGELHIAPGTSAGGCIQQALKLPPGALLDNQDLLSCGPLLPMRALQEWQHQREQYARILYPDFDFSFSDFHRDLLSNAHRIREAESVTLWVGTGLAEQLLLAWVPQLFRLLSVDLQKLRLIQFCHDPDGGQEVQSVGILHPEKLKPHPAAAPLEEAVVASLDKAWSAVTASTPSLLVAFLAANPGPLPFLQRSLQWLMFRFPDADTGLGIWEMELLRQVAEKGPTAIRVVGYTMVHGMDGLDWVGDAYLFARLKSLADPSLRQPLISLKDNSVNMREAEVSLTRTGKDVLDGKANAVALNGIDDWVGGIHLDSAEGEVWFQRKGVLVADRRLER